MTICLDLKSQMIWLIGVSGMRVCTCSNHGGRIVCYHNSFRSTINDLCLDLKSQMVGLIGVCGMACRGVWHAGVSGMQGCLACRGVWHAGVSSIRVYMQ